MQTPYASGVRALSILTHGILRLLAAVVLWFSFAAHAKPVEMVIPLAPGGAMDVAGRTVAEESSKRSGEPIVILNKAGAGTLLGTRFVAEQGATDGRTLLLGAMAMTTGEFGAGGTPFDISTLSPVAYVGWQVTVLYVRADLPVNTMAEFVQWAKTNPNGVNFGSSGNGSSPHLAAEYVAAQTGIKITHIPYAGSSAFIPALVGGHIDAVFDAPSTRALVKSGKLKALMVGSSRALPDWPELPTADAAGLPGFRSGTWYGVFVPAKTPADTVRRINADVNAALLATTVRDKLVSLGIEPVGGTPADFSNLIATEREKLRALVKARSIVFN